MFSAATHFDFELKRRSVRSNHDAGVDGETSALDQVMPSTFDPAQELLFARLITLSTASIKLSNRSMSAPQYC